MIPRIVGVESSPEYKHDLNDFHASARTKGRHHLKMKVLIRALPERGGGLPMPEFFGPFFPPSNFHHTRKTSFLSAGKKRTKVPELGGGV